MVVIEGNIECIMNEDSAPYVVAGECMRRRFKQAEETFLSLSDRHCSLLLSIFRSFLPTNEQPASQSRRSASQPSKHCPVLKRTTIIYRNNTN